MFQLGFCALRQMTKSLTDAVRRILLRRSIISKRSKSTQEKGLNKEKVKWFNPRPRWSLFTVDRNHKSLHSKSIKNRI